jgi:hypothetical protein
MLLLLCSALLSANCWSLLYMLLVGLGMVTVAAAGAAAAAAAAAEETAGAANSSSARRVRQQGSSSSSSSSRAWWWHLVMAVLVLALVSGQQAQPHTRSPLFNFLQPSLTLVLRVLTCQHWVSSRQNV